MKIDFCVREGRKSKKAGDFPAEGGSGLGDSPNFNGSVPNEKADFAAIFVSLEKNAAFGFFSGRF